MHFWYNQVLNGSIFELEGSLKGAGRLIPFVTFVSTTVMGFKVLATNYKTGVLLIMAEWL